MIDYPVLKAFLFDLLTTAVTLVVGYLTIPDNVAKMGVGDVLVPVVVGIAGAALIALRRYNIIKKQP